MIRNETSAAGGSETSSTEGRPYFFLNFASFRMFRAAQYFRETQRFLRKPRSRIHSLQRKVERVVLNALGMTAVLPPNICASGDGLAIGPSRTGIFRRSRST
jgi:hypothetical protein